jgi:protein involved in polysaccharide export with SLBB domain
MTCTNDEVCVIRARPRNTILHFLKSAAISLVLTGACAPAQTAPAHNPPASDLEQHNLGRVAARSAQLVGIFYRDPGLLVELKRWIARDATNHGQVIADPDLTDEAIFDRLETDIAFRAQATLLVQKYGYLIPEVNPDSSMSKEQALQMQERARLRAQYQEEESAALRQKNQKRFATRDDCLDSTENCSQPPISSPRVKEVDQTGTLSNSASLSPSDSQSMTAEMGGANGALEPDLTGRSQRQSPAGLGSSQPGLEEYSSAGSQPPASNAPSPNSSIPADQNSGFSSGSGTTDNPALASGDSGRAYDSSLSSRSSASEVSSDTRPSEFRARDRLSSSQQLIPRANPYRNIPSLFDMYLQAAPRPAAPERFGMQIFENGTRDLANVPMDLPAGPDYIVGPGDGLTIDIWGGVVRHFYRVVDREGRVTLPEIGPLLLAGKSLAQTQETLQAALRKQFRDVSADVSLSRLHTVRVYIVGDVQRPGAYDISSLSTPLNALFAAGGPTARGSLRNLRHYRGGQLLQDVDTYDLLLHGVKGDVQHLENGDSVVVPPLGPEVTVEGMVRRPAIYELKGEKNLSDVIELAGGLLPTATLRHVEVQRVIAHEKQTMLSVNIAGTESVSEVTDKLDSFSVADGDKLRIFPIAPYNQDAVYLDGHVIRPGKYSFHDGLRITDLVGSYKDLLPEPAGEYGEIIRLAPPDYRPQAQSFNLTAALADPAHAPLLQPLDTVLIFGRYDFENAPTVSVLGDVRSPGVYRASGDIHLSDAIHLAGGLAPDADLEDAQVFRYLSDSNLKIFSVKLSSALDGSPVDNIVLNSRDRILVHANKAASDPATVYVKGDVAQPGRYPMAANMRLSDLIRAAGGLQQSADPNTADLTRYEWNGEKEITGRQEQIDLPSILTGAVSDDKNITLHNGDVLSIRQRPGWTDVGATITLRGEVLHPGTYGIRPGETLSSVLQRAGGFTPAAYPYGSLLTRLEVRQIEEKSYAATIQRVRQQQTSLKLAAAATQDPDEKTSDESAYVQWQSTLDNLVNNPPSGRVAIQISSNLQNWAHTNRDIVVRDGDVLRVPKRPSFVVVQGQVYGPTAISYRPGKSARWYLTRGGGPTNLANKGAIFVIRADGTVIGGHSSLWKEPLSATLQPGDMVIVPEKALGGPRIWKTIFQDAQILSSITTSAFLAANF